MSIQRWIEQQARKADVRWSDPKPTRLSDRAREALVWEFIEKHSDAGIGRAYRDPLIVRRTVKALESQGIARPTPGQIFQELPRVAWGKE